MSEVRSVDLAAVAKLMGWSHMHRYDNELWVQHELHTQAEVVSDWQLIGAIMERLAELGCCPVLAFDDFYSMWEASVGPEDPDAMWPSYRDKSCLQAVLSCAAAVQAQRDV